MSDEPIEHPLLSNLDFVVGHGNTLADALFALNRSLKMPDLYAPVQPGQIERVVRLLDIYSKSLQRYIEDPKGSRGIGGK
jgi:hypothetical protein